MGDEMYNESLGLASCLREIFPTTANNGRHAVVRSLKIVAVWIEYGNMNREREEASQPSSSQALPAARHFLRGSEGWSASQTLQQPRSVGHEDMRNDCMV